MAITLEYILIIEDFDCMDFEMFTIKVVFLESNYFFSR
jgi:hypothetical protein